METGTRTKPTTARKATAPAAAARTPATGLTPPSHAVASSVAAPTALPVVASAEMKKKELIDAVVARSGIKKKDAKPVVEAMLAVLGETVAEGRELNLQPLGKLKINRCEDKPNGKVIICRLRQPRGSSGPLSAT